MTAFDAVLIAVPPVRREESAIKLSFEVASLSRVRAAAAEAGGSVDPVEREWEGDGRRYVDGADPEGNVVQFYTSVRERRPRNAWTARMTVNAPFTPRT